MRRSKAPTLQDIADAAGVSIMMASVVINGAQSSTRVSPSTRQRILDVAARLRYRRNAVAHGLSRKKMDTIGVAAVIDGGEVNVYILEVLNGILEGAAVLGQNTTVFSLSNWHTDSQRIPGFCDGRVDGMILIAPYVQAPETLSHHTPFVSIHGNEERPNIHNLDVDNEGGAYEITKYLVDYGHRTIAHLTGNHNLLGSRRRIDGYRRAIEEAGMNYDESLVIEGTFSVFSGRQRTIEMLNRVDRASVPTAIFCGSDAIAYGCMEALGEYGLRVPEDISIAGFDDTLMARMTRPPLTTVRQPFREMGRCAVETLIGLIEGPDERPPSEPRKSAGDACEQADSRTHAFPAELIVRESVGPPRTR